MQGRDMGFKDDTRVSHQEVLSRALLAYVLWLYIEKRLYSALYKQSLSHEPVGHKITSIFNDQLEITKDMWAVSYLRKSHSQHGFLFIQSENKFSRIELVVEGAAAIKYKARDYDINLTNKGNLRTITKDAIHFILWPDEDDQAEHTLSELCGKTWLIPKSKAQQLIKDTEKDTTNPPQYFKLGGHSLLQPGVRYLLFTLGFIGSARVVAGFGTFIGCLYGWTHIIGAMPTPLYAPLMVLGGIQGAHEMKTFIKSEEVDNKSKRKKLWSISGYFSDVIGNLALQVLIKTGFIKLGPNNEPVMPAIPNQHSCATWIVEKLRNLGIKEINDDLTPSLFDAIAYVTSSHLEPKKKQYNPSILLTSSTSKCTIRNTKPISNSHCIDLPTAYESGKQQFFGKSEGMTK